MTSKFKIDFLGIGAERAGTTWLAQVVREHPEVCFSKEKELFFFNDFDPHFFKIRNLNFNRGLDWYKTNFPDCTSGKKRGEFSPTYMYSEETAKRIRKLFPDVKLIVILRDPVERAYSQYINDISMGLIKDISFEGALGKYDSYFEKGLYAKYLRIFYKYFSKRNVFICLNEDISQKPKETVMKLYKFLDLKKIDFEPGCLFKRVDPAVAARFHLLNSILVKGQYLFSLKLFSPILDFIETSGLKKLIIKIKTLNTKEIEKPQMKESTKKTLKRQYRKSIQDLEKVIRRDLNTWK